MQKCDDHERCQQEFRDMWIRIENCEQDCGALREAMARGEEKTKTLFTMLEKIEGQIEKLIEAVDGLRLKPARRWDTVVTTFLTGGVGAFIAWFLTKGTP